MRFELQRSRSSAISERLRWASVRALLRDLGVFVCSFAVVALLVAYAFAGGGVKLAAVAERHVGDAATGAVVSGRLVDEHGNGVAGARVLVEARGRAARRALSSRDGLFRMELAGRCARYVIRLSTEVHGRALHSPLGRRLCPGESLRIRARVVSSGQLLWMPR